MTDEESQSFHYEIRQLHKRLDALASDRAAEITNIRESLHALEQRLAPPVRRTFTAPTIPLPQEAPPAQPPVFPKAPVEEPVEWEAAPLPSIAETRENIPPPSPPPSLPVVPKGSFELSFGRIWLVRLGIALLVTGLVLLGNFAYKNWIRELPAIVRLAALYLGSFAMCGAGLYLGARESMRRFSDVLLAGGLAFFYWCTFAAHHVPRLQVIESPITAGVLLLGAAGAIVGVSLRRESRVTATMGLLLASYSTILQPLGWLSATSNVVLAMAGTAFMRRPGWALPGIASMAGTYLSFFWWQIAGGHGGRPDDPSSLWFLPPVWAVFALPGVIGVSRHFDGLSDRARSIFASVNNVAFFLLFSALWVEQHGFDDYWVLPAVFGAALLALGVAGRSRDAAGGVHVAQGLGALTLAMAIKLDGYHLALGFAMQTLALSFAFRRFTGKSELAFAILATAMTLMASLNLRGTSFAVPLWSRVLVALLLVAAAFPLRAGCDVAAEDAQKSKTARAAAVFAFAAGNLLLLAFCSYQLPAPWNAPACGAIGLVWSAFTLLRDPARRLPEAGWTAFAFGLVSLAMLLPKTVELPWWSPMLLGVIALAAHRLWLNRERGPGFHDLAKYPDAFLWLSAFIVSAAAFKGIDVLHLHESDQLIAFSVASVGIVALGRFAIVSPILQVGAAMLLAVALQLQADLTKESGVMLFVPVFASLAAIPLAGLNSVTGVLARFAAGFSWLLAWNKMAPHGWCEVMAATAVAITMVSMRRSKNLFPESWIFLAVAAAQLLARTCVLYPWAPMGQPPFPHGGVTVAAYFAIPLLALSGDPFHRSIRHGLLLVASALLALWTSQAIIWHFDWKPVAILWTALGFGLVCVGLWRKLSALRHAGFALLAVALVKLFAVDVWDFGTFIRIAAFLALGVALVVLGFFYNRFADALKKLFEGDEA